MKTDVLGFGSFAVRAENAPPLQQYSGRDGSQLSFRFYDSIKKDKILFLFHGSSGHGEYLHAFAHYLSTRGVAQVVVPNLRGHYGSGGKRGDCAFIGQLEEDLYHFINTFDVDGKEIYVGGHSTGGGFAIRYGAGPYGDGVKGLVLLAPAIPQAPTMREGTAGGWAKVSLIKMIALQFLNSLGFSGFNHTKVIEFNKPKELCDGRETLSYSYNLYASCHPRQPYEKDIAALKGKHITLVGSKDEAMEPFAYKRVMQNPRAVHILEGVNHLNIVQSLTAMEIVANWIKG